MPLLALPSISRDIAVDSYIHYGAEIVQFHTRLLRVSLAAEESHSYWQHYRAEISGDLQEQIAFEERWFGSKSMERTRLLLKEFAQRYNAYPDALAVLHQWQPRDPIARRNLCHWHLQFVDPIYRAFTDTYLVQRRSLAEPTINRDTVGRWVSQQIGKNRWSPATLSRMATGLIAVAAASGLCTTKAGERMLIYPQVSDIALEYWLYFLRHATFSGTLLDNPYLRSVGLTEGFLETRLQRLSSISFRRMGDLIDFGWKYSNLASWAVGRFQDEDKAL